MPNTTGAEIVGNQSSRKTSATSTRNEMKDAWQNTPARLVIGLTVLTVAIVLAFSDLSIWGKIILAGLVWFAASKLEAAKKDDKTKGMIWVWPAILKGMVGIMLLTTFLNSGLGLVTRSVVETIDRAPTCLVDHNHPKCIEHKRREAEEEARELAERVQKAAALAAAREAVEQARLATIPLPTSVKGSPCSTERGKFKTLTAENECRVVTFKRNEKYHFAGKEGYCPRAVPGDAGRWVHLGGTQYDFVPHRPGSTVTFYLQKKGETFLGNYCS